MAELTEPQIRLLADRHLLDWTRRLIDDGESNGINLQRAREEIRRRGLVEDAQEAGIDITLQDETHQVTINLTPPQD